MRAAMRSDLLDSDNKQSHPYPGRSTRYQLSLMSMWLMQRVLPVPRATSTSQMEPIGKGSAVQCSAVQCNASLLLCNSASRLGVMGREGGGCGTCTTQQQLAQVRAHLAPLKPSPGIFGLSAC